MEIDSDDGTTGHEVIRVPSSGLIHAAMVEFRNAVAVLTRKG